MASSGGWVFAPITNIRTDELERTLGSKCLLSQHVWLEGARVDDLKQLKPYLSDITLEAESLWGVYLSPPTTANEAWVRHQLIKVLTTFDFLTVGSPIRIPVAIWVRGKSRWLTMFLDHAGARVVGEGEEGHFKRELSAEYLRTTWQMLEQACHMDKGLVVCLERFTGGIRHSDGQDLAMDVTIALESIVRASTEIAFRFSLYLALISTAQHRNEAFDDYKLLYELRSSAVHGDFKRLQKLLGKWESKKDAVLRRAKAAVWYYIQFLNLPGRGKWENHLRGLALGTESVIGGG